MRDLIEQLLAPPIPLLLAGVVGLGFWPFRRVSTLLLIAAIGGSLLLSVPLVAGLVARPLAPAEVPTPEDMSAAGAIVVPLGGVYADGTGGWWPSPRSVVRGVGGLSIQGATGLPLILSGGRPRGEGEAEASATARVLDAPAETTILDNDALTSLDTAERVPAILKALEAPPVVVLVTNPDHCARMAAMLRHQGLEVMVAPAAVPQRAPRPGTNPTATALGAYLPSASGLRVSASAIREYAAILWYLLRDRIDIDDLA